MRIKYPPSEEKLINLLEKNITVLIDKVPTIEKVILFGSYARNEPHYGSDFDLLFIVNKRIKNDFEVIYELLYDLSLDFEWSPQLHLEVKFKKLRKEGSAFIKTIINKGIELWP